MRYKGRLNILIFLLFFYSLRGQTRAIRTVSEVVTEYSADGSKSVDTLVYNYDREGNRIGNVSHVKTVYSMRKKTVDSTGYRLHQLVYFSDSTTSHLFTDTFNDSTVVLAVNNGDTIHRYVAYFRRAKLVKELSQTFQEGHSPYKTITYYEKRNLFTVHTKVVERFCMTCEADTVKYRTSKLNKTRKEYVYNKHLGEWYRRKKEKYNSSGLPKAEVNRNYHEYHKQYFLSKTRYRYDSSGLLVYERSFVPFSRLPDKKIYYTYTYY